MKPDTSVGALVRQRTRRLNFCSIRAHGIADGGIATRGARAGPRYGTTRWTGLPRMLTSQVVTSWPEVPTVYSIFHQPGCVSPGGVGAL